MAALSLPRRFGALPGAVQPPLQPQEPFGFLRPQTPRAGHLSGQIDAYINALRDNDVTGLTDWNPMTERP